MTHLSHILHHPQPVIVGSDLSGLLISIALSRAEIAHVLIGESAGDRLPRVGQILTPVSTLVFAKNFPELAHLAYPKSQRMVYLGPYAMGFDFSVPAMATFTPMLSLLGGTTFSGPWNLDRVAADQALFEKAVGSPFCTYVQSQATAVEVHAEHDRIQTVTLADGVSLPVSHLFDATGSAGFVGQQLAVPRRSLGPEQLLVHAIYRTDGERETTPDAAPRWVQETTSLARLYRDQHGVDGMAACVPLGDAVAIHGCAPAQGKALSAETLLTAAQKGLSGYGVHYRDHFSSLIRQGSEIRPQFVHARAYGANWLLTGSAYSENLVGLASTVDTSLAALDVAVPFIKDPAQAGALYQRYMDWFGTMQKLWVWGVTHELSDLSLAEVRRHIDHYAWANQSQFFYWLQMQNPNGLRGSALTLMQGWMNSRIGRHFSPQIGLATEVNRLESVG